MFDFFLLSSGLLFLIKGADFLVNGSSQLALKYKVPKIIIGLTIVAFGTSTPELVVNTIASINHNNQLAIGNILGSNIANILLILGISLIIKPIYTSSNISNKEIPFSLFGAIIIFLLGNDIFLNIGTTNMFTRFEGIVLLICFIIFLYYTIFKNHKGPIKDRIPISSEIKSSTIHSIILIILGLTGLTLGGKWIIDSAINIANNFNLNEKFVGLTIISLGTSLPELATSIMASLKKQSDIVLGNIIGSNIFNTFLILGVSSAIYPIHLNDFDVDILTYLLSTVLLFLLLYFGKKNYLSRINGIILLLSYIGYIIYLFKINI